MTGFFFRQIERLVERREQRAGIPVLIELQRQLGHDPANGNTEALIADGATWARSRLAARGVILDGSLDSLLLVDPFLEEFREEIRSAPSNEEAALLWAVGAYFGGVLRNARGGDAAWTPFRPKKLVDFWSAELALEPGRPVFPMQRAGKRFQEGETHSLHFYATRLLGTGQSAQ